MRSRPLAPYSALQRDLLHVVESHPGASGAELIRQLEDVQGETIAKRTGYSNINALERSGLIEASGPRSERAWRLTSDGAELLERDREWQRDR